MGLEMTNPTDAGRERKLALALVVLLLGIAALAGLDAATDLTEGTTLSHVLLEGLVILSGMVGAGLLGRRLATLRRRERDLSERAADLTRRLESSQAEAARWRAEAAEALEGLGAAIDAQFERWGLSPAEREVALLLLKGLSHKEVASVRGVGGATTRQQARAVYKKAGLAGRHDLSAFFLEDLLLPRPGA